MLLRAAITTERTPAWRPTRVGSRPRRPVAVAQLGDLDIPSLAQTQAAGTLRTMFQGVLDKVKAALAAAQQVTAVDAQGNTPSVTSSVFDSAVQSAEDAALFGALGPLVDAARSYFSSPGKTPSGTPASVAQAWIGAVKDATTSTKDGVPFLEATLDKAVADASGYGKRWLETAKALRSELTQVLSDQQNVGLLAGIDYAIDQTEKQIGQFIDQKVLPRLLPNFGLAVGVGVAAVLAFVAWKVFG